MGVKIFFADYRNKTEIYQVTHRILVLSFTKMYGNIFTAAIQKLFCLFKFKNEYLYNLI